MKWKPRMALVMFARLMWGMRKVHECQVCGSIFVAVAFDGNPEDYGCWCCLLSGKEAS